jgi:phage-related protein (TIGR01555 family)
VSLVKRRELRFDGSIHTIARRIHASRVLHIHAGLPPILLRPSYNFFSVPHAQILYDYIVHFQDCRQAAQRLITRFSRTVMKTNMMEAMQDGFVNTGFLDSRVNYMVRHQHNEGITIIDKESEDITNVTTPITGVSEIVQQALEYVAAINRTPVVKLLGLSPSGFNSTGESDIRNYYDYITSQCELVLRPGIKKALDVLQLHVFGDIDESLDFDFNSLWEMDEAARAAVDSQNITAMLSLYESQAIGAETLIEELKARGVFNGEVIPEAATVPEERDAGAAGIPVVGLFGADAEFDESRPPRDATGKFGSGGNASGKSVSKSSVKNPEAA